MTDHLFKNLQAAARRRGLSLHKVRGAEADDLSPFWMAAKGDTRGRHYHDLAEVRDELRVRPTNGE
jgi:hypothetical protein